MKQLITNTAQIVTPERSDYADGDSLGNLKVYEKGSLLIENGIITDIITHGRQLPDGCNVVDAHGAVLLPAFTDPHTHIPFAGSRENEFNMRIQGATYMDIAASGGGINSTVTATRAATEDELFLTASEHLTRLIHHGVGNVEMKSGYGLNTETELKQLAVIKRLKDVFPLDIKATFMGAHEIPAEYKGRTDDYVQYVISEMLPAVKAQGIADYCDIFTEKGVFDIEQSRKILTAARDLGFAIRMHADEIYPLGGAELAGEMRAVSADHLMQISPKGITAMKNAGTVFTLLPGTSFFLKATQYAPARDIINAGGIVALSTDLNPGSSHTHSMQMIITLACLNMGMTVEEAITAATLNGAYSLGLTKKTGSLHVGKQADILFLDAPNFYHLVYNFGVNRIRAVMKKGTFLFGETR